MRFSPAQLRAVRHGDGPMMVLAGPGSGKTTVIVGRLRCLMDEKGVPPERILVITFTRAAADEMRERFFRSAAGGVTSGPSPVFGTFHSVFFSVLKQYRGFSANSLIKPSDQAAILKKILADPKLPFVYTDDLAETLLAEISKRKAAGAVTFSEDDPISLLCSRYQSVLTHMRLLDFDDMLLYTRDLFHTAPVCLREQQNRFRYILIDEFQDINPLQYEIVRMLAARHRNLFIVGDDDQSIYSFRGSDPRLMLQFSKLYPDTKVVLLDVNYRSGSAIVSASERLIRHNRVRLRKTLKASGTVRSFVRAEGYASEEEEHAALLRYLSLYQKAGFRLSDMAVLYRTGAESAPLRSLFFAAKIPYREIGKRQKRDADQRNRCDQSGVSPASNCTGGGEPTEDFVYMATFHASKGLEFAVVFILSANEGVTPHARGLEGEALEEERRMFYVAMTRAKRYLHILNTKSRYNKPQKTSQFVLEATEAGSGFLWKN